MASRTTDRAFCMILSRGVPTPSGLVPAFPILGMRALLAGLNFNLPVRRSWAVLSNHAHFIPSRVSGEGPGDMIPGFPLMAS